MTEFADRALLPAGLRDLLPPYAAHEADMVGRLMAAFGAEGYERVKPPLIEFEESLLTGSGAATAPHTFRVMDPVSQRMMGVRADMTLQVARIATTRLANVPRPLRLSYAGEVLRVKGSQLRPERQFGQAGIELIGSDTAEADAEVIILAAQALMDLGMQGVSVDLSLPTLGGLIVDGPFPEGLRDALDRKDAAGVAALGGSVSGLLGTLVAAVGPAEPALAQLGALDLPPLAAQLCRRLAKVVALLREAAPGLILTIDPVENRGFEYHTGIAFTIFARHWSGELGRGGCYQAQGESATGVTLFMDTVLDALAGPAAVRRLFIPAGVINRAQAAKLRQEGWVTVAGLAKDGADPAAEARRLGCDHFVIDGGRVVPVDQS
ncbi:MAG TPA: ATP phosphoribosyltransferase regulatory subunit [Rhodospirillaceae bacterium]|nr:ATP phosphoribosyltransferase regulatory subunit [Rhodospirillaceae bacterium]